MLFRYKHWEWGDGEKKAKDSEKWASMLKEAMVKL
jgi:hypothetical protein